MQQFLASQSRLMSSVSARLAVANRALEPPPYGDKLRMSNGRIDAAAWPLLGEIVDVNSQRLHSRRRFDVTHDLFLRDHTFGHRSPNWPPNLLPLPVIPFTMSMEMIAEAACCLLGGGKSVVGLSHLRGHRWLSLDSDSLVVEIQAQVQPSREAGIWNVAVRLFQLVDESKGDRRLAFEGAVTLAECYPAFPNPMSLDLKQSTPATISAGKLYRDLAFHGPCFQSVKNPIRFSRQGIDAIFRVTAKERFFSRPGSPTFQIPPDLLDAASHAVYLWLIETESGDYPIFPFYAGRFQQYVDPQGCETEVLCRARINSIDRTKIEASFDFLDQDERVIARFEGLHLKQYRDAAVRKLFRPQTAQTFFSNSALASHAGLICRRANVATTGPLDENQGIWKRVLAHLLLSERERDDWSRLPEKGTRRAEWLMGRAAAKDAVRQWTRGRFNLELTPVEIEIVSNRLGRPIVACSKLAALGSIPNVSISHSVGEAIAVAVDAETRVGIDIECLAAHPSAEWVRNVLAIEELELVNKEDTASLVGLWCAKESASKAFGTGLEGKPPQWRVLEFVPAAGTATVAYGTDLFEVRLWRREGVVIAVCEAPALAEAFPAAPADAVSRGVDVRPHKEE